MLGRLLGEDVELAVHLDPDAGLVMADADQLHQVLMNLVVNARDALPEGGRLTLRTSRLHLDESSAALHPGASPGPYVLLEVSDSGVGMSEEVQQMMFDPFYTTKGEAGTGLGLSTVYGIVRQAGGWIAAESQPGMGTTFRIGLPFLSEAEPQSPASDSQAAQLEGSETILVVEDQEEVRSLAVKALGDLHYRTLEAKSGAEALAMAENGAAPIDLVLTDVVMPGMNGRELADRLRLVRPEIKVLYMSGYAADVMSRKGLIDLGAELVLKPFTLEGLARKVRSVLGIARRAAKVLVADDDPAIRDLLAGILKENGYEVAVACDGLEAQKALPSGYFDLVITDLVMPNAEGLETIRKIRASYPGLKVIALSGALGGSLLGVAKLLGANATLHKPVGPDELLATVRKVLG